MKGEGVREKEGEGGQIEKGEVREGREREGDGEVRKGEGG